VIGFDPDADRLADRVVMVAGHQRQGLPTVGQHQRVEDVGPSEGLVQHGRAQRTGIVVDDVVRTQQHLDIADVLAVFATTSALGRQIAGEAADADVDAVIL
jgi:hypothetical protein